MSSADRRDDDTSTDVVGYRLFSMRVREHLRCNNIIHSLGMGWGSVEHLVHIYFTALFKSLGTLHQITVKLFCVPSRISDYDGKKKTISHQSPWKSSRTTKFYKKTPG